MLRNSGALPLVRIYLCYTIIDAHMCNQSVYLWLSQSNMLIKIQVSAEQDHNPHSSLVLFLCFAESIDEIWQHPTHQDTNISSIGLYQIKQL